MKRSVCLLALLIAVAVVAPAQTRLPSPADHPKVEFSLGYSYNNLDGQEARRQHGHGGAASFNFNVHPNIGFALDLGAHFGDIEPPGIGALVTPGFDFKVYQALIGPRFTHRAEEASAFFHVLFGAVDTRMSGGTQVPGASGNPFLSGISHTDFAMAIGGGVDVNITRRVALRVFQLDWIPVFGDPVRHDIRGSVGFTFRFH